jgi:hypothetical protein
MATLVPQGDRLVSMADGLPDRVFIPTGEWEVTSEDQSRRFTFVCGMPRATWSVSPGPSTERMSRRRE